MSLSPRLLSRLETGITWTVPGAVIPVLSYKASADNDKVKNVVRETSRYAMGSASFFGGRAVGTQLLRQLSTLPEHANHFGGFLVGLGLNMLYSGFYAEKVAQWADKHWTTLKQNTEEPSVSELLKKPQQTIKNVIPDFNRLLSTITHSASKQTSALQAATLFSGTVKTPPDLTTPMPVKHSAAPTLYHRSQATVTPNMGSTISSLSASPFWANPQEQAQALKTPNYAFLLQESTK